MAAYLILRTVMIQNVQKGYYNTALALTFCGFYNDIFMFSFWSFDNLCALK